jgi:hypothetical protein
VSTKRIIIAIIAVVGAVIVLATVFGGQPDVKVDKAACRTALGSTIQSAVNNSNSLKEFQAKMEELKSDDGSLNVPECKGEISDDEFNAIKKQALTDSTPVIKLAALKWAAASLSTPTPAATTAAPANSNMTANQEQAKGKAQDYLNFTAFSKAGLVNQLVQFDHFSKADATFGVTHVDDADWKAQALKKAQQYLAFTHFSRSGLTNQLVQFDKFTAAEAKYGVNQAFNSAG